MESIIAFLIDWGYWGMLISAFLAGTIVPFSSETILLALLHPSLGLDPTICVIVATIGNTLGGLTCYFIGRAGNMDWIYKYFKVSEVKLRRMKIILYKRSGFVAFFAFLPGIGTVIAITLGLIRSHLGVVTISMIAGKLLRYILIAFFAEGVFSYFV